MNIESVLKALDLDLTGSYSNGLYVIDLIDSNDYAKMYTHLSEKAINTEEPNFATNTSKNTIKITNYFEIDVKNITYNIFLIADFDNDKYYIKIGEK